MTDAEARKAVKDSASGTGKEWHVVTSTRGAGALMLRTKGGVGRWYFRYTSPSGKRDTLPLAAYADRPDSALAEPTDSKGKNSLRGKGGTLTHAGANAKFNKYCAKTIEPSTADVRAHVEAEENEKQATEKAKEAAKNLIEKYSLAALCRAYADHLQSRGKSSAKSVRGALELHVIEAHPGLSVKPAQQLTKADAALIVRTLIEAGSTRAAGIIRSYLHAAYRLAQTAEGDPTAPAGLIPFAVEINPIAGVRAVPIGERHRVLTADELRVFLAAIESKQFATGQLVHLALLLGGQRPAQLARVTLSDFDKEAQTITLRDPKGRRATPRRHVLPLAGETLVLINALADRAEAQGASWLFSHDGKRPADFNKASAIVADISAQMVDRGESREPFQLRDVRRTVETMLAALAIGRDTRAQLLSHGLSGVQAQRYDRHDYLSEKRAALAAWTARLDQIKNGTAPRKVTPIRRSK